MTMTWEMIFVMGTVLLMVCGLLMEWKRPEIIMGTALTLYLITGILSVDDALKGFSNPGIITIGLLFMIAGAIKKSGIIDQLVYNLLLNYKSSRHALLKMMIPTSCLSAFMNNTPIVMTFTPIIRKWCEENNFSPSKFLLPLSYGTILGGTISLAGTSTNVIVHGMMLDTINHELAFFQFAVVGLPLTLIGILYMLILGFNILPDHSISSEKQKNSAKEYLGEVLVTSEYPYVYQTIQDAGLRKLTGLYLLMIIREGERIFPVKSTTVVKPGDRLIFTGLVSTIVELKEIDGLEIITKESGRHSDEWWEEAELVEAVVSHQSPLLYKKIKDTQFRGKYDAAVVAVHRKNERINQKIGEIILKPGDTLLLLTGTDFYHKINDDDFYVITPVTKYRVSKQEKNKNIIAILLFLFMILSVTFQFISLIEGAAVTTVLFLLSGIIKWDEIIRYMNLNVLFIISCSIGIGEALVGTGTAKWLAGQIILLVEPMGLIAVLFSIYFLTNLFTEVITNNASAIIMFPIAMEVAASLQLNPVGMATLIAIAASSSFSTPIGYQTNLIVYGPGGYKFIDYVKVGLPLNLIVMLSTVFLVYKIWMT